MDVQDAYSMIMEEDIAEDDEDIITDWYLEHSLYVMK